jgi:hypothetical protein
VLDSAEEDLKKKKKKKDFLKFEKKVTGSGQMMSNPKRGHVHHGL